ncbi:carboxypeptidase B-like isoform X2 [Orussus abietinus]|uniref:carboxypeptidase B-like isoform X2 n=1 Tax=Orussus abietinus TaxID=222816 RepID=UPI000625A2E0|nr:carboxypeptidase B-like isoform X2 [Orussus abietinus]
MTFRSTDVAVAPGLLADVKRFLKKQKIDFEILIPDLQRTIARQNPKMSKEQRVDLVTSQGHPMTWKRYHRYGEISKYLNFLALRYPHLVELVTIGRSYEGQEIKLARVSSGANENGRKKPAIWIDAGMHAREWIGSAVATYILRQLVEKNATHARFLKSTDWIILPVANPDGYEFSHTGDRLWRKTRSTRDDDEEEVARWFWTKCEGVDPNRNFGYQWGVETASGASSDPCHETYAGPEAFSEPETRAIADYIMANRRDIRVYLTLHSYSQMWLVPWSYTRAKPSDYSELVNVAKKAADATAKIHGTRYKVGSSSELLHPISGASDDWAKAIAGIKYSYTMELRDRGTYGFLLPASQIVPTAREAWAGIRAIARLVASNT